MAVVIDTNSLTYVENSMNIANNTTQARYLVKLKTTENSHNDNNITSSYTINGVAYTETHKLPLRSTTTIVDKTVTVTHNADGTKSINASFSFPTGISAGTITGSASLTLPTIPRASSITVADANIGSSTNITINKASSNFTTTLYYKASGQGSFTKIVDKTSNQVYGWTVPTSFYALIPNAKTITCQFYAETYSGNTLVGTSSTVSATFTATGNPVINSCSLVSTDSTTTNLVGSAYMIRYISTVKATVSVSPAHNNDGSSITSVKVNNVAVSLSGTNPKTGSVSFAQANTYSYQVVVTDSRGYSTTGTYAITWTDYVPLSIDASIKRNTATDNKIRISYSGNYFNSSFRGSSGYTANTLTVQYRAVEYGESFANVQWTTLSPTKSGNTYSQSNYVITSDTYAPSGYDYQKQYVFQIRAGDLVSTKIIDSINVPVGQPAFWWDAYALHVPNSLDCHTYVDSDMSGSINTVIGEGMKVLRKSGTWSSTYFPNYSAGMAWKNANQGGFIIPACNTKNVYVGGISENLLAWNDRLLINSDTEMKAWTPVISALNETNPTVSYTYQRGRYALVGKTVFFNFYIRAKITALNGTNNYARITGLPYEAAALGFGAQSCNIGVLYSAIYNPNNVTFLVDGTTVRIQNSYGTNAASWIATTTSYMEIGGSGWYFIN